MIALATVLTLVALNPHVGRAVFHVQCHPNGGDIANVARACRALDASPDLITQPKPFRCFGGLDSWWDVTIRGRLAGQPIAVHTSTCWTPQMPTIKALGIGRAVSKHLVPRRRGVVAPGTTRTFLRGVLRRADLVTCTIFGRKLEVGVPIAVGWASGGYSDTHLAATLRVTLNRDGSVTASCHKGTT